MADTPPQAPPPDPGPLPPGGEEADPARLARACRAHQRQRWLAGDRVPAETYLKAYPRLTGDPEAALDVIYGEFLLREELGPTPTAEEYLARFPRYAETLALQFAFHEDIEVSGGTLAPSAPTGALTRAERPAAPRGAPPPAVPGYEVMEELGRGGMGVVYRARHVALDRVVALKMIGAGARAAPEDLERFRTEALAVARLQHPNFVQIFEVGEHDGAPFLSLEFVEGGSLADRLQAQTPAPRAAAALVEVLARAMAYAHQRGLTHRDLKPANVLLAADGTPKITDFGLAKQDRSELTATGVIVGTPSYMAPEQAAGDNRSVGPAADVHALGALLYELLAGRPPFRGVTVLETLEQVRSREAAPPSQFRAGVPRDLETICLQCLQKAPRARYATALDLAEDLRRFQAGEPIRARPVGPLGRAWRWARRNPTLAGAGALAAGALAAAAVVALLFGIHQRLAADRSRAETAATRAALAETKNQRDLAERRLAEMYLDRALERCAAGECGEGLLLLARSLETIPPGSAPLERAVRLNLTAWRRQLHEQRLVCEHAGRVSALAFSPDGKTFLTGGADGNARLWDARAGRPVGAPLPQRGPVVSVAFGRDGQTAVTCDRHGVRFWESATGGELVGRRLDYPASERVLALHLLPGGAVRVATARGKTVRLWDGAAPSVTLATDFEVRVAAFSPDGGRLLAGGGQDNQGEVRLWELASGRLLHTFAHEAPVTALALSRDGTRLLTGTRYWKVRLWDVATGTQRVLPHPAPLGALAFSADGRHFLTGCSDGKARVWETAAVEKQDKAAPAGPPLPHQGPVSAVAFSPDGRRALTASDDGTARLWDFAPAPAPAVALRLSDTARYAAPVNAMAFSPDGRLLATGADDRTACLWDTATGKLFGPGPLPHADAVQAVAFSGDGRWLVTGCDDGTAQLWRVAAGDRRGPPLRHPRKVRCVALDRDGTLLAAGGTPDGTALLWDTSTGDQIARFPHGSPVGAVALSPDGRVVLTSAKDGTARFWGTDGRVLGTPLRHLSLVRAAAFSPDNRRALTGSADTTARLCDVGTGAVLGTPLRHQSEVRAVAFSPDGTLLATGAWDQRVRVWDEATRKPIGAALRHSGSVFAVAFSPDGKTLFSAGDGDNVVQRWAVPAPAAGDRERMLLSAQVMTGLELDDAGGVLLLDAAAWHQRRQRLQELGGPPW